MPAIASPAEFCPIDRIAATAHPAGRPIGHHCWTDLLFVHWRLPAEVVRPLLPAELTLDTWEGDAWVGLVPFYMSRVRPWWSPPVPGVSYFCETNVRTYVHFRGREPGVWFFSLDASNSLAVRIARWRWHLPYFRAEMSLARVGDSVRYSSRRLWPGTAGPGCAIRASVGPPLGHETPARALPAGRALPGTLEHFLIERYILYASPAAGQLLAGRVHHRPYPIREARLDEIHETLLAASGLASPAPPCHTAFSDGVDVEIFPLWPVRW
ncbi:MAG: YqjF family protein [Deltaproteobacteria bacterium]